MLNKSSTTSPMINIAERKQRLVNIADKTFKAS